MTKPLPQPDVDIRFPGQWSLGDSEGALRLFLDRVNEFCRCGSFQLPYGWTISFSGGDVKAVAEVPSEIVVRNAVMAARHFTLQDGNPTRYGRVCDLLRAATSEARFHREIALARQAWKELLAEPLKWRDARVKTRQQLFNAFCSGRYFHSNEEARKFLARMKTGIGPLLEQQFAETLFLMLRGVLRLAHVVMNALGADLLAPGRAAQRVRSLVEATGTTIGPIEIQQWGQDPARGERCGVQCDLQFRIEQRCVEQLTPSLHRVLVEEYPGLEDYGIFWFTPEGVHRTRYLDPDGRPESSVWRAFNRTLNALRGMGPKLPEGLAEIAAECERASRSATKRGNADLAALLTELAGEAQAMKDGKAPVSAVSLESMRRRWTQARDR